MVAISEPITGYITMQVPDPSDRDVNFFARLVNVQLGKRKLNLRWRQIVFDLKNNGVVWTNYRFAFRNRRSGVTKRYCKNRIWLKIYLTK